MSEPLIGWRCNHAWTAALVTAILMLAGAVVVSRRAGLLQGRDDVSGRSTHSESRSRPFAEISATVPWTAIAGPLRVSPINRAFSRTPPAGRHAHSAVGHFN